MLILALIELGPDDAWVLLSYRDLQRRRREDDECVHRGLRAARRFGAPEVHYMEIDMAYDLADGGFFRSAAAHSVRLDVAQLRAVPLAGVPGR